MDTKRSLADLLALSPDNTSGLVSNQDLRDMLVSLVPSFASLLFDAPVQTTFGGTGQWAKAAGGTSPLNAHADFDFPAPNRLRYIGVPARQICLFGSGNLESASNNQEAVIGVAKNDVIIPGSPISRHVTNQNRGAFALNISVPAVKDDYFELYLRNDTSSAGMTIDQFNLFALAILL